jgi:predicted nucleic-acid-binding Zn-ribbon protein
VNEIEPKKCPKCGNIMEGGAQITHSWGLGRLETSDNLHEYKITAFRCGNCGYIELYTEEKGVKP